MFALFVGAAVAAAAASPVIRPPIDVLMIGVDDLRPELAGPYGQGEHVQTPNLARLAARSVTFGAAYCQYALCGPSRASLLTSIRPDYSRVWTIGPDFRDTMGGDAPGQRGGAHVVTLPMHFKRSGYHASGAGKIFHPGTSSGSPGWKSQGGGDGGWPFNATGSWSEPYFFCDEFYNASFQSPANADYPGARAARAGCVQSDACNACLTAAGSMSEKGKPSHSGGDCPDSCYPDGAVADEIVARLAKIGAARRAGDATPFFLAAGFKRPHLGWFAPQKWFDMYPPNATSIAKHTAPPPGMPHAAFTDGQFEICGMSDVTCGTINGTDYPALPLARHAEMRAAYYAVVSFMDSQLGRVLDALDEAGLAESTAVAFWGDHGAYCCCCCSLLLLAAAARCCCSLLLLAAAGRCGLLLATCCVFCACGRL